jgi:hypothetical protein
MNYGVSTTILFTLKKSRNNKLVKFKRTQKNSDRKNSQKRMYVYLLTQKNAQCLQTNW